MAFMAEEQNALVKRTNEIAEKVKAILKSEDRTAGEYGIVTTGHIISALLPDIGGKTGCEHFGCSLLNEIADVYYGEQLSKLVPRMLDIYNFCVEEGYTQDNQLRHNDSDNRLFYIPMVEAKVFCFEDQNCRYCFVQMTSDTGHSPIYLYEYEDTGKRTLKTILRAIDNRDSEDVFKPGPDRLYEQIIWTYNGEGWESYDLMHNKYMLGKSRIVNHMVFEINLIINHVLNEEVEDEEEE